MALFVYFVLFVAIYCSVQEGKSGIMMSGVFTYIEQGPVWVSWVILAAAFAVLAKCADLFVDSAVGIAERLHLPKLMIGIVLVSVATTSPELSVSLMAALRGSPEMALGNAIGSVICNCGIALALCAVFSKTSVPVLKYAFRTAGGFLVFVSILCALFVGVDLTLSRIEGGILLLCFAGYLGFLVRQYKQGHMREVNEADVTEIAKPALALLLLFLVGLAGVILSSKFVVVTSVTIAKSMGVPEAVIALTLVALGTSIPEVATSVVSAIKGQGALSVGNILGANIMNICWVAGSSSLANPLSLSRREINFMFPAMFIIVAVTVFVLHTSEALSRREGAVLFGVYCLYIASFFLAFQ